MTFGIFGFTLGVFWPSAALEAAVKFEPSVKNDPFTGQCFEQLSFSPDSQASVFCLTSIKTQALAPSPCCPSRPLQFNTTQTQSKLEEEGIKMGNLPVIPCTMAKGAICLISSHFCRSAVWPTSISPSIRPPMRPWRVSDERLREGA